MRQCSVFLTEVCQKPPLCPSHHVPAFAFREASSCRFIVGDVCPWFLHRQAIRLPVDFAVFINRNENFVILFITYDKCCIGLIAPAKQLLVADLPESVHNGRNTSIVINRNNVVFYLRVIARNTHEFQFLFFFSATILAEQSLNHSFIYIIGSVDLQG